MLRKRHLVAALRRRDPLGFRHLGVDQKTEGLVTVREYAPAGPSVSRQEDGHLVVSPEDRARWSRGLRGFLLRYDRMAALRDPGLVEVRGKLMTNGTAYALLEQEPGETLGALLAAGERFNGPALASIAQDILRTLAVFHRRGVAHGGIHPWTIALTEEGRGRIVDIGWFEPEVMDGLTGAERSLLPPEVLEQPLAWQPAGDLYCLGVLAVALQHGEPVDEKQIEAARGASSPAWLQRLLQMNPADRPDDADDLLESWDAPPPEPLPPGLVEVLRTRLREVGASPPPPLARRALLLGTTTLVAAAGAGLAYGLWPRDPKDALLGAWRGAPGGGDRLFGVRGGATLDGGEAGRGALPRCAPVPFKGSPAAPEPKRRAVGGRAGPDRRARRRPLRVEGGSGAALRRRASRRAPATDHTGWERPRVSPSRHPMN